MRRSRKSRNMRKSHRRSRNMRKSHRRSRNMRKSHRKNKRRLYGGAAHPSGGYPEVMKVSRNGRCSTILY